ncbi:hypothetical protein [Thalassospira sp. MCCC 1A01428]|uniref:hypothetical protein n=1 Tax=Thalassospira sp. MCCC 1A01428 TaxID=1470575 RepID=UPI00111C5247|nr:hypothetical protein [Thalassospira sp. MCCC 1A01428]
MLAVIPSGAELSLRRVISGAGTAVSRDKGGGVKCDAITALLPGTGAGIVVSLLVMTSETFAFRSVLAASPAGVLTLATGRFPAFVFDFATPSSPKLAIYPSRAHAVRNRALKIPSHGVTANQIKLSVNCHTDSHPPMIVASRAE